MVEGAALSGTIQGTIQRSIQRIVGHCTGQYAERYAGPVIWACGDQSIAHLYYLQS